MVLSKLRKDSLHSAVSNSIGVIILLVGVLLTGCSSQPLQTNNETLNISTTLDSDSDNVLDDVDNCPQITNPDQLNLDNDALGNACDPDYSNKTTALAIPSPIMEKVISYSAKNKFEMRNSDSNAKGETLYQITSSISGNDVDWLKDHTITNAQGTSKYSQNLHFTADDPNTQMVLYAKNQQGISSDYLFFKRDQNIARYNLEFSPPLASRIVGRGDFFIDLIGKDLVLLGKKYTFINAQRPTGLNSARLVFMRAPRVERIGTQTEIIDINKTSYTFALSSITPDQVKLSINGQATGPLRIGDLTPLSNIPNTPGNTQWLGIGNIIYQGEFNQVEIYLGAEKLEIQDDLLKDVTDGGSLKIDDVIQDFTKVGINGDINSGMFSLSTIDITLKSPQDFYVSAHSTLLNTMAQQEVTPPNFFTQNWDLAYDGLSPSATHPIEIIPVSDERYELSWYEGTGRNVRMPLFEFKIRGIVLGGYNSPLILRERSELTTNAYVVLTTGPPQASLSKSYLVQYQGWNSTSKEVSFIHLAMNKTYVGHPDESGIYLLPVGGVNFPVLIQELNGGTQSKVKVDLNGDGDFFDNVSIVDDYGLAINLDRVEEIFPYEPNEDYVLYLTTPNKISYDNTPPTPLEVDIKNTGGAVGASIKGYDLLFEPKSFDTSVGYTSLGSKITWKSASSLSGKLTIDYPQHQRYPIVRVIGYSSEK